MSDPVDAAGMSTELLRRELRRLDSEASRLRETVADQARAVAEQARAFSERITTIEQEHKAELESSVTRRVEDTKAVVAHLLRMNEECRQALTRTAEAIEAQTREMAALKTALARVSEAVQSSRKTSR